MRIKRKSLILLAWQNSTDPSPAGKPAEPMPQWLKTVAEPAAEPGTTFTVSMGDERKLVRAEDIVYQAPNGTVHSIDLARFKQEYDEINLQAPQQKASTEQAKGNNQS